MSGIGMAPCATMPAVMFGFWTRNKSRVAAGQDQPTEAENTSTPMLKRITNVFKRNKQMEKVSFSKKKLDLLACLPKFKKQPKAKVTIKCRKLKAKTTTISRKATPKVAVKSCEPKSKESDKSLKPKVDISSCLEKLKKRTPRDAPRPSVEPLLIPSEPAQSSTSESVTTTQPKVFVLEGHNDDPIWFDHVRPKGAINKSMRVFDMAEADTVLLTVGSVNDPLLTKRLSEIPDEKSKVIITSRNFRLRGIPSDRCTIVTANPSADFDGTSTIDTSTRVPLPHFPPSNFAIGIVANDPQTARDWVNQRREILETMQVGDHSITLVSNHKPGQGSQVDGYIVIAEDNYDTIALPEGPWPIVGVFKDPDMDAIKQLPGATRTTPLALCLSDPLPSLVKRIIYRKLVDLHKRGKIPINKIDPFINIQGPMPTINELD
ncbi:unnamed protein product [Clonostachys rosea]|uniref:Uncharacterized protein n=1 Tax=Bionectria ochroleuca TaxID=29856 RepID=A0ABY6V1H0_BIOOC|nr:unnamed protein product [Clonostachys rosea]